LQGEVCDLTDDDNKLQLKPKKISHYSLHANADCVFINGVTIQTTIFCEACSVEQVELLNVLVVLVATHHKTTASSLPSQWFSTVEL
jgi:hypothetical protein